VKVYAGKGAPSKTGRGIFAGAFLDRFPLLPAEEEGRLHDPRLRENFLERVFALKRWRAALAGGQTAGRLVDFHTREKLLLLAHSPDHYRRLGKIVAGDGKTPLKRRFKKYQDLFLETLGRKATAKKNANVLMHVLGYFKKDLSSDEKHEILEVIEAYRNGLTSLLVPVTLLKHFVRKYDQPYLKNQTYFHPHPVELKLRTWS